MKLRIAAWAGAGVLVAILWNVYISATPRLPEGAVTLVYLTCPIALARHYAISFYSVLVANAATYALVGAVVETMWRRPARTRLGV